MLHLIDVSLELIGYFISFCLNLNIAHLWSRGGHRREVVKSINCEFAKYLNIIEALVGPL